jgi:hypothetical protein
MKEGRPIELAWGTVAERDDCQVLSEGRMVLIVAVCRSCGTRIKVTQHATRDERDGSYSIL